MKSEHSRIQLCLGIEKADGKIVVILERKSFISDDSSSKGRSNALTATCCWEWR